MKYRFVFGLCFLLLVSGASSAQKVTGEWYGVGNVNRNGAHNSYLTELILVQKGNKVTGSLNYFFKSNSIQARITGVYLPATRTLELKATPVLNYKARDINGADCPMEGSFTLTVSRVESSLRGQFNPTPNYRFTCPAINIKLVKQVIKPKDPEPEPEEPVAVLRPVDSLTANPGIKLPPADTIQRMQEAALVTELNKRTFEVSDIIEVDADSLQLSLYDNGEIDGDTISLFHNRKLVAAHKLLTAQAFTTMIALDTSINEISMLAENLGSIPPNTAICVIYAGTKRYELALSSNFIKNATLRFRKKPAANKPPM
ncbi:hypothetical protein EXU57_07460 [Segetibacter sp. 3557_3]|uniref:hypothetical protein n=1 Tax=Segetibacter sp. 3557_3 TaxID=2547429 RepID=UPI0010586056|nr:hypothetical protein [Segetibacter sp. 3557_3]TDH27414.1 hypothetical protein EXU57_07460 [Segetibacter sp. 3557_3]